MSRPWLCINWARLRDGQGPNPGGHYRRGVGRIWIRLIGKQGGEPRRWLVYSKEGERLGVVLGGPDENFLDASGTLLLVSKTDELDVPSILGYRFALN